MEAPQITPLIEIGASAAEKKTLPLAIPRTTRTKRQDIGNQVEDAAKRKIRTYPFPGVVRKLMRSRGASATIQTIREGACPLM